MSATCMRQECLQHPTLLWCDLTTYSCMSAADFSMLPQIVSAAHIALYYSAQVQASSQWPPAILQLTYVTLAGGDYHILNALSVLSSRAAKCPA